MGITYTTPEAVASRKITKKMRNAFEKSQTKIRCLLLGPGESGKSTFVKQMRSIYGKKHAKTEEELVVQKAGVYNTILSSFAALLKASDKYIPLANSDLLSAKELVIERGTPSVRASFHERKLMTEDLADMLKALWNDEGIRQTWENHRSAIQAQESLAYYMSDADRVLANDYEVIEMDWLRSRVRTTGVLTEKFMVQKIPFVVIDVGGQRNERKKWIHVLNNVTSVIYVAALNEYDQWLYEDSEVNRMQESLTLFDEMVNNEDFLESGMILFLNKDDLFREKIRHTPIPYIDNDDVSKSRWTDYTGPNGNPEMDIDGAEYEECYNAGIEYFTEKFLDLNQHPNTKEIYVQVTFALDKSKVDTVLGACWDLILKKVLNEQGFLRD